MSAARSAARRADSAAAARRWMLLATSLGFSVVQLDVSIVNVAIKSIGSGLGGGVSGLQWVVNAYTIAFAACILTAGSIADRIGARRLFVGGFVLFMAASAACGLAPDLGVLVGARAVSAGAGRLNRLRHRRLTLDGKRFDARRTMAVLSR